MNRRHVNAAITAGLALTMTVGSVPPQAFAEMMKGDTTQVVAEQSDATGAAATSADTGQTTSEDQTVDKIASLAEQTDLHVAEGSDATLPQTVAATYESGTTKQENVTWKLNGADASATLAQLPAGSYEFEGTVDGATQTVKQRVVIEAAAADPAAVNAASAAVPSSESGITVVSIESNPIIEKYVGFDNGDFVPTPALKVKLSDGTEGSAYVQWDEKSKATFASATEESEIAITGQIFGASANGQWYSLAEPFDVTGVLKVYAPRTTGGTQWSTWTAAGFAPTLASNVSVYYSNGESRMCPVVWNNISEDQYQKAGTFIVEGHIKDCPSMLVHCTVNVRAVKSLRPSLRALRLPANGRVCRILLRLPSRTVSLSQFLLHGTTWRAPSTQSPARLWSMASSTVSTTEMLPAR